MSYQFLFLAGLNIMNILCNHGVNDIRPSHIWKYFSNNEKVKVQTTHWVLVMLGKKVYLMLLKIFILVHRCSKHKNMTIMCIWDNTMAWWVEVSPHSKKILTMIPRWNLQVISKWSLHVLFMSVCHACRSLSFLPQNIKLKSLETCVNNDTT